MWEKVVDDFLPASKFVPDWFATSKIIEELFADDDILFFDEHFDNVTFSTDEKRILNIDDANFDEDNPETIIHVRHMAWCNRYKQRKVFEKDINKELRPVA